MEDPEMMMVLLQKLTEMGTGLAIDDFGIGYCGLSYLRHFQFSRLKIDQSFVRSVLTDTRDAALTAVIVNMARVLKMKVIAECVETAEQMKLLHSIGCQEIQGYYFSRPVSASVFAEKFLHSENPVPSFAHDYRADFQGLHGPLNMI
jgi:EAL domain-containing protein (putative c-di-GMP-specific phosphodiesterase class I)